MTEYSNQKFPLPPCRICGAPGAGFHYGVNTCEACKGFFHRSLTYSERYKCDNKGTCLIQYGRGKMCRQCRYQKCIDVGMSKAAIKTGRYNYKKKTEDILEVKQMQEIMKEYKIDPGDPFFNIIDPPGAFGDNDRLFQDVPSRAQSKVDFLSTSDIHGNALSGVRTDRKGLAGDWKTTSPLPGQPSKLEHRLSQPDVPDFTNVFLCHSYLSQHFTVDSRNDIPSKSSPGSTNSSKNSPTICNLWDSQSSPPVNPAPCDDRSSQSILQPSPYHSRTPFEERATLAASQSSPCVNTAHFDDIPSQTIMQSSPYNNITSFDDRSSQATSQQNVSRLELAETEISHPSDRTPLSFLSSKTLTRSCSENVLNGKKDLEIKTDNISTNEIERLFQDSESIIKTLVNAHEQYLASSFPDIPEEELAKQQREHYEACMLRSEMFGKFKRIRDHEYDEVYRTTGIDVDGRQFKMAEYAKGMETIIQGMVFFAKAIPGFSNLTTEDKINLIKYSRQEFCFLNLFKFVNRELKVYRGVENIWHCIHDIETSDLRVLLDHTFSFLSKFQLMNLTPSECVILQALSIMAPDRGNPITTSTIPAIYDKLVDLLLYELKKQHERPMLHFAKIMSLITECRTKEEDLTATFKKQNYIRHIPFNDKPFLHEMFTGIYLDDSNSGSS